jgi:hypothetical protein
MDELTAEEFLKEKFRQIYEVFPDSFKQHLNKERFAELHVTGRVNDVEQNYPEMMIEFTKIHVAKALKAAENEVNGNLDYVYPLENIK